MRKIKLRPGFGVVILLFLGLVGAGSHGATKDFTFAKVASPQVVVFLSSRCPCSHSHVSGLLKLKMQFSEFDFHFVHSNANENQEKDREYFKNLRIPVIDDTENQEWLDYFHALKTPHAFVVQNGKVVYSGGVDDSNDSSEAKVFYLKEVLMALREQRALPYVQQRALGCAIKRNEKS